MKHYGNQIIADNFNEIFINAIYAIYTHGKWNNPRQFRCKEIIAAQLILTDPSKCLPTIKERKLNYAYLIIEKFMYLSQISDPEILIAYNSRMKEYLNLDTQDFDGAYGPRIAENNQLDYCYHELKRDPDSRRAVVTIHNSKDCQPTKDSACTLSWQFMIREGKLDMIVNMRSQDILWGLCLDMPAFCFIQEVMAWWLGVPVGKYIHNDASLHYYEDFEKTLLGFLKIDEQSADDYKLENVNETNKELLPIWRIPKERTDIALREFWKQEKCIREKRFYSSTNWIVLNQYLERLLNYWKKKDANVLSEKKLDNSEKAKLWRNTI